MVGAWTPMSRLDDLPHDQRAALSLLLRQRKSYAEVASLLGIEQRAVHDRAHAALAVLAPREARQLSAERREEIGEYLLGQQASLGGRLRTRTYLEGSAPARGWARALAAELGYGDVKGGHFAGGCAQRREQQRAARSGDIGVPIGKLPDHRAVR